MLRMKNGRSVIVVLLAAAVTLIITLGGTYLWPAVQAAPSEDEAAVMEAARRDLPTFRRVLANLGHQQYGLRSRAELDALRPGKGVEVYILTEEALDAHNPDQALAAQVIPSCQWQVPLQANGQSKLMLTVAFFQERWQAVEIGDAQLAGRWHGFQQGQGRVNRPSKLVRVPPLGANFALVEGADGETMVPLSAYGGALPGAENLKPYKPSQLIPIVRKAVKQAQAPPQQ